MADKRFAGSNGLSAVFGQIKAAIAEKQDKINGKSLSTNDYDNTEKALNAQNASDIAALNDAVNDINEKMDGDATTYPYADVITINDAVPANLADCSVKVEPVQDLHGYDKPWVGGAGKNKLPMTVDGIKAANTTGTWSGNVYTISGTTFEIMTDNSDNVTGIKINGTTSSGINFNIVNGASVTLNDSYKFFGCDSFSSGVGAITYSFDGASNVDVYKNAVTSTISGTFIHSHIYLWSGKTFNNVMVYPMFMLASESDDSFAPYTNICPISGHTEAVVTRVGKNLADWNINIPSYALSVYLKPGTYTISGKAQLGNGNWYFRFTDNNGAYISDASSVGLGGWSQSVSGWFYGGDNNQSQYFIVVDNCKLVEIGKLNADGTIPAMLNAGNTALPYVHYACQQYTLALGDTIYGGTVDFDSGVMTVDRQIAEYDGSEDESWLLDNSGEHYFFSIELTGRDTTKALIANNCENAAIAKINTNLGVGADARYLRYRYANDNSLTVSDLKTFLESNNLQVCYSLTTPFTVQLTPQQIQLLQGQNTIYASTGDISVTVNGVSGSIGAVQTQANATDNALAQLVADIAEQLPDAPSTDGTYSLQVTVSSGTPIYSWVSSS